jgi:hypothetical protein
VTSLRALALALLLAAPPVRVGDLTLRLRRIAFTRERKLTFDPGAPPTTTASAELEVELGSRKPEALDALPAGPLTGPLTARDNRGRAVAARGEIVIEDEKPVLRLRVEGLAPDARMLRSVQGQLRAYAGARRIRFHIPWLKDEVPLSVQFDGGTATLKRFQLVGADSTLWVSITPPEGYRVVGLRQPGALSARAMDIDGNLVNGGGITRIERTPAAGEAEFRFEAPDLRRTPSRLVVDVLCVAGGLRSLPFKLENITIPRASLSAPNFPTRVQQSTLPKRRTNSYSR